MTWEERFPVVSGTAGPLAHLGHAPGASAAAGPLERKAKQHLRGGRECNLAVGDFGLARLLPGKLADELAMAMRDEIYN
jgi:hypothetical protein